MKFIKLLSSARVNGLLRHPSEGVLHLEDDEAHRLIDNKEGEDVTADFTAKQNKEAPVEGIDASDTATEAALGSEPVPHQSQVAPQGEAAEAAADKAVKTSGKSKAGK